MTAEFSVFDESSFMSRDKIQRRSGFPSQENALQLVILSCCTLDVATERIQKLIIQVLLSITIYPYIEFT